MTKENIAQLILNNISTLDNLNKDYICNTGKVCPEASINQHFCSFDEFKSLVEAKLAEGVLTRPEDIPAADPEQPVEGGNNEGEGNNGGNNSGGTKVVKIMKNDGSILKATVPVGMNLKQILSAAKINTEEGFEIRVNNTKEEDVFSVPDDGAIISATRQIKGNC